MANPYEGQDVEITSPDSGFSFANVFNKATGLAADFGSAYLTVKAQEKIATEQAKAQQRLNTYSAVNPSLGAVNPKAAAGVAGLSPVQSWLPFGSPITGTAATTAGTNGGNTLRMVLWGAVLVGVLFLAWKLIKKL